MHAITNWKSHLVPQKHWKTGCIPWAYELLLRFAGAQGVDFAAFQEDFDLERLGVEKNHFGNVAQAVSKRYPHVEFKYEIFPPGQGQAKIVAADKELASGRPILLSVCVQKPSTYHIMPVLESHQDSFTLLGGVLTNGDPAPITKTKAELISDHDMLGGGYEFSYLERWK